jgi:hypothetical protein
LEVDGASALTRRFLGNAHHEELRVDGRRRWRFREREKARRTHVHVSAVEDRYVQLAIHYIHICVHVYVFLFLNISKGCPCLLYISTRLGFIGFLVEFVLESSH